MGKRLKADQIWYKKDVCQKFVRSVLCEWLILFVSMYCVVCDNQIL